MKRTAGILAILFCFLFVTAVFVCFRLRGGVQVKTAVTNRKQNRIAEIQKSLGIAHDSPVLRMECTTLLEDGTPLYYVECYYIGAKYYFSTILPRK